MFEMNKLLSVICNNLPQGLTFEPSDTSLSEYFPPTKKGDDEQIVAVDVEEPGRESFVPVMPRYPIESQVVAIDTTNFTLGQIPEGLVGAVRASIITKPAQKTFHSLEKYGPYLVPITNQNKDLIYRNAYRVIYEKETEASAPDCLKTLDRIRNFLERYIQTEIARTFKKSLILLDGSLIGGTIGDPAFVLKKIVANAAANGNSIVAISKSTGLTLKDTQKSILSLLDGIQGPVYVPDIKKYISQSPERYLGDVYVARLTPLGEPFRVDIPKDAPLPHDEIFSQVAGLAGEYGYPEELKLAHMTCVLSSIEIVEMQSAAIVLHGLTMKEELRPKIFPL
jgi:hypothetical protein